MTTFVDFVLSKPSELLLTYIRNKMSKEKQDPFVKKIDVLREIIRDENDELFDEFMKIDFDVNEVDSKYRSTMIMFAAEHGNPKMVKELFSRGASIANDTIDNKSVLFFALTRISKQSGLDCAKFLINNGADVEFCCKKLGVCDQTKILRQLAADKEAADKEAADKIAFDKAVAEKVAIELAAIKKTTGNETEKTTEMPNSQYSLFDKHGTAYSFDLFNPDTKSEKFVVEIINGSQVPKAESIICVKLAFGAQILIFYRGKLTYRQLSPQNTYVEISDLLNSYHLLPVGTIIDGFPLSEPHLCRFTEPIVVVNGLCLKTIDVAKQMY